MLIICLLYLFNIWYITPYFLCLFYISSDSFITLIWISITAVWVSVWASRVSSHYIWWSLIRFVYINIFILFINHRLKFNILFFMILFMLLLLNLLLFLLWNLFLINQCFYNFNLSLHIIIINTVFWFLLGF